MSVISRMIKLWRRSPKIPMSASPSEPITQAPSSAIGQTRPVTTPERKPGAPEGLTIIRTARTQDEINAAAQDGFRPLVRPVVPSPEIKSKFSVLQNDETGEIKVIGDFRSATPAGWHVVIPWTNYYPHNWPEPFAAYLIPPHLAPGERVQLDDLIEDMVGTRWNQGNAYRATTAKAVWTGRDLLIEEPEDIRMMIG